MTTGETLYLALVLGGFAFFGVAVATLRWEYTRWRQRDGSHNIAD